MIILTLVEARSARAYMGNDFETYLIEKDKYNRQRLGVNTEKIKAFMHLVENSKIIIIPNVNNRMRGNFVTKSSKGTGCMSGLISSDITLIIIGIIILITIGRQGALMYIGSAIFGKFAAKELNKYAYSYDDRHPKEKKDIMTNQIIFLTLVIGISVARYFSEGMSAMILIFSIGSIIHYNAYVRFIKYLYNVHLYIAQEEKELLKEGLLQGNYFVHEL